jgi:hypothetical protein
MFIVLAIAGSLVSSEPMANTPATVPDPRHISCGWEIPSEGYADQPYVVKTDDGAWLCVMTTGPGHEGAAGQHVLAQRSLDQGRTWSERVALEPLDGPEASYAVLLKVPGGRIYCFYNHNTDNVREVKREDQGVYRRVDSLGHYVFKYSDDHGRTWSADRFDVPIREFACDRENVYGGNLRFFWNVGRPLCQDDRALMVLHKVGAMGAGFFAQSEGVFFASDNILHERDPHRVTFVTLPDGDIGLRTPAGGGRIAEEQSVVALSDGSLYCVYRTVDGWPACAYSRDRGHTWSRPEYATYSPGGRRIKHPRAANFVWKCDNGRYLYWFHNHGGATAAKRPNWDPYEDRNPAWLVAGREVDTPQGRMLCWSQPEIVLYDDDPLIRMSYPDLIEDGGRTFVTETQKDIARVHEIPSALLEGLFAQHEARVVAQDGLLLQVADEGPRPKQINMPALPALVRRDTTAQDFRSLDLRAGFTFDMWLAADPIPPGSVLLDSRDSAGRGILITVEEAGRVRLVIHDGHQEVSWCSDRASDVAAELRHVVITVDGGPKIITFVVDGELCDGGDERQFGWGRYSPTLQSARGGAQLTIGAGVKSLRIYGRPLRTSEAIGNFRAGFPPS